MQQVKKHRSYHALVSTHRRLQATLISGTCHDQCSLMHVQTRDVFHQLNMTLMAPVVAEVEAN